MAISNLSRGVFLVSLTCIAVQASASPGHEKKCKIMGEVAEKVMRDRQTGRSLSSMIDSVDSVENKSLQGIMKMIVISAYDVPRYGTREHQERAVGEFADMILLSCLKAE